MTTVWALSDLHLSLSHAKPMDKFGDHWGQHDRRMAENWDSLVSEDDVVLTPGDFSWSMKTSDVAADMAWLAQRPGTKILVKGNHDYWWPSTASKMAQVLPAKTFALKKTACIVHNIGFFGARGGDFAPQTRYGDTRTQLDVDQWLDREESELSQSLSALERLETQAGGATHLRICLFHYPPIPPGQQVSRFTPLIERGKATWCVYGHLHGLELGPAKVEGTFNGVTYLCTSCDQVGFAPKMIVKVGS